jgi:quercetin dioxygenase-like cupin family protein
MNVDKPIVKRASEILPQSSRRAGIKERRLITQGDSSYQNIILVDAEQGAEVELHEIKTSESIFIMKGAFEFILPESSEITTEGDVYHFPPGTSHGLRCTKGPGQFLVIWAPPIS